MKNKIRLEEEVGGVKLVMFNELTLGTIYAEVDGFYVFKPNIHNGGFYGELALLKIAEILTNLNDPWGEYIKNNTK